MVYIALLLHNTGITADTAENRLYQVSGTKWQYIGSRRYSNATTLLICVNADGSDGYRLRLCKKELRRISD